MKKVFIDGQHGTVGLQIRDRLLDREDIEILEIEPELRKETNRKTQLLNEADFVFLCLPDQAARESVSLITNPDVRVIDSSTAHRTHPDWVYGIPELNPEQRSAISGSKRIANPGCYATGFALMVHPLVREGLLPPDYPITTYAITGYSGGGNKMIQDYETHQSDERFSSRPKNLDLKHKHIPEMTRFGLLKHEPIFTPIVGSFFQGMLVFVPIHKRFLGQGESAQDTRAFFTEYYSNESLIHVVSREDTQGIEAGFIDPTTCNGTNLVDLFVFERDDQLLLVTRLDNLGKGAAGAAIQNLNLLMRVEEQTQLNWIKKKDV